MKSAVILAGLLVTAPDPSVEKACPKGICTIPAAKLQLLLDMHNQNIMRIEHLEAELLAADRSCFVRRLRET